MPKTKVKAHRRRGTRGVKGHSRNTPGKKTVPHNRDVILSPKEIASIRKILDKNKLVKDYSIKKGKTLDYLIVDVNYKTEEIDFGAPPGQDHGFRDYAMVFNISKSSGVYDLVAYNSYHFWYDHKFERLYRKKVKKFSTVLKNIEKTTTVD